MCDPTCASTSGSRVSWLYSYTCNDVYSFCFGVGMNCCNLHAKDADIATAACFRADTAKPPKPDKQDQEEGDSTVYRAATAVATTCGLAVCGCSFGLANLLIKVLLGHEVLVVEKGKPHCGFQPGMLHYKPRTRRGQVARPNPKQPSTSARPRVLRYALLGFDFTGMLNPEHEPSKPLVDRVSAWISSSRLRW